MDILDYLKKMKRFNSDNWLGKNDILDAAITEITTLRARVKELGLKHQDSLKDFVSNLEPYAYEIDEDAIHQLNKRISQSEKDGSAKPINLNIIYKDLER